MSGLVHRVRSTDGSRSTGFLEEPHSVSTRSLRERKRTQADVCASMSRAAPAQRPSAHQQMMGQQSRVCPQHRSSHSLPKEGHRDPCDSVGTLEDTRRSEAKQPQKGKSYRILRTPEWSDPWRWRVEWGGQGLGSTGTDGVQVREMESSGDQRRERLHSSGNVLHAPALCTSKQLRG